MTSATSISVGGNVNDIVVGTVNSQQAQVTVNGVASQVANRTFLATNIPLNMGSNTIQAVAVDRAGNSATTQITVIRQTPQPGQITLVSGNNQSGTIGTALSAPLVIALTDSSGTPAANKQVIFCVTQNNGMLNVGGGNDCGIGDGDNRCARACERRTGRWACARAREAMRVQAYSVGYSGTAIFTATANQGAPGLIVVDTGNNQTGAVNQAAAETIYRRRDRRRPQPIAECARDIHGREWRRQLRRAADHDRNDRFRWPRCRNAHAWLPGRQLE